MAEPLLELLPLQLPPSSKSESAASRASGLGAATARPPPVVKAAGTSNAACSGTGGSTAWTESELASLAERRRLLPLLAAALPGMVVKNRLAVVTDWLNQERRLNAGGCS